MKKKLDRLVNSCEADAQALNIRRIGHKLFFFHNLNGTQRISYDNKAKGQQCLCHSRQHIQYQYPSSSSHGATQL